MVQVHFQWVASHLWVCWQHKLNPMGYFLKKTWMGMDRDGLLNLGRVKEYNREWMWSKCVSNSQIINVRPQLKLYNSLVGSSPSSLVRKPAFQHSTGGTSNWTLFPSLGFEIFRKNHRQARSGVGGLSEGGGQGSGGSHDALWFWCPVAFSNFLTKWRTWEDTCFSCVSVTYSAHSKAAIGKNGVRIEKGDVILT